MADVTASTNPATSQKQQPIGQLQTSLDESGSSGTKSLTMTVISILKYPITQKDPPENVERGNWNNRAEFVLSCMGYAIGLGNLWRFPYKVYENGGGSFIFAYLLMLVLIAFPFFLLDLAIGQFSSNGPVKVFRNIMPMHTGMGYLMLARTIMATCSYTPLMAYALLYLCSSFQPVMPWQTCKPSYNTQYCFASTEQRSCHNLNGYYFRTQCYTANSTNDYKTIIPRLQYCLDHPHQDRPADCVAQINIPFSKFTTKITLSEWLKKPIFDPEDRFIESVNIFSIKDKHNLGDPDKRYKPFNLSNSSATINNDLVIALSHYNHDTAAKVSEGTRKFFKNYSLSGPGGSDLHTIIENTCEFLGWGGVNIDCMRQVIPEIDPRSVYSSEEYFSHYVRHKKASFWNLQGLTWQLTACHFVAWFITGIGLIRGPKLLGRIVYFTSIFPMVIILVFVIYGATLPGNNIGYTFFLKTDWTKLSDANVWKSAASQIFFSLSIGSGGMMTLASYNHFHNDFVVDAGIVATTNCLVSFVSGFAVFAILGNMAEQLGKTIPEVVKGGMGLAFVAYSHATSDMPLGHLWAILWFLNLFILGIDTNFALLETCITWFCDEYPAARNHKWMVVGIMSAIFSILGLVNIARGGSYFLAMMDEATGDFLTITLVVANAIMICYIYGAQRFVRDIQMMLGIKIHGPDGRVNFGSLLFRKYSKWYAIVSWSIITPVVFGVILISTYVNSASKKRMFTSTEELPVFGKLLFWGVAAAAFPVVMVACALYTKYRGNYTWKQMIKPTKEWGPALNQYRDEPYIPLDSQSQSDEKSGLVGPVEYRAAKPL